MECQEENCKNLVDEELEDIIFGNYCIECWDKKLSKIDNLINKIEKMEKRI